MSEHKWLIPELASLTAYAKKAGLPEVAEILSETREQIAPILARDDDVAPALRKQHLRAI